MRPAACVGFVCVSVCVEHRSVIACYTISSRRVVLPPDVLAGDGMGYESVADYPAGQVLYAASKVR